MNSDPHSETDWQPLFEEMARLQTEMESLCIGRPLDRAEGSRYLARLLASGLEKFSGRPGPVIDYATPRIGGFNPDYLFGRAAIDRNGRYRIRGRLNDVHRLAIGTYTGQFGNFQPIGYLTKDRMHCDSEGRFEILISDEMPAALPSESPRLAPNWLAKSTQTSALMIRQLVLRASDRPADLDLERIDRIDDGLPPALTPEHQHASMKSIALFVAGAAGQFFRWTRVFSQISNRIEHVPEKLESEVKADPDTFYAIGYFDLAEDEYLEVRVTPPACDYWGIQTTNHWLEPIEHDSIVTHRNQVTSEADPDGTVTLSISPVDHSHENSLHTLGHRNGAIFYRTIGSAGNDPGGIDATLPSCRVRKRSTGGRFEPNGIG